MSVPGDFFDDKGNFIPMRLVSLITSDTLNNGLRTPITERGGDTMWHYKHELGIWKPEGIAHVKEQAREALGDRSKAAFVNEVVFLTLIDTYIHPADFVEESNLIVVKNGTLNLETMELTDHNWMDYAKTALPVDYDPDATCPTILNFLDEIISDAVDTLQEWLGYHLYRDMIYHKAAMFIGDGANGKTTLQDVMNAFLGPDNVSHVNLYKLVEGRFSTSELYLKLANISPEIASGELKRTGTFKSLTGHDRIMAEKKYRDPFYFINYAKLTFLCNQLPTTPDMSRAFYRRWLLFVFPNKFEGANCDPKILEKLTTPGELSGLLNWAINGLHRLQAAGRFTKSLDADELQELYESMSDPITAFIDERIVRETSGVASKDAVYQAYHQFCRDRGYTSITKATLTIEIKARLAGVLEGKRKIGGKPQRCWVGLRLKIGTPSPIGTTLLSPLSTPPIKATEKTVPRAPTVLPEASQEAEAGDEQKSLQELMEDVLGVIGELEGRSDSESANRVGAVQDEDLFAALEEGHDIAKSETARLIGVLMRDGTIYSPRPGFYRRTA